MSALPLTFIPPTNPDIIALNIYESSTSTGTYALIERVTDIGTYPDYISEYTTENAINLTDWFSIAWETSDGILTDLSQPLQGGTTTLIGEIVERVMLRDDTLDENIVVQEAEATVSFIYKVTDPYSIDISTVSPLWLTELSNLTLVAVLYVNAAQTSATTQDYTAGMISERNSTNPQALGNLEKLERRSLRRLGIGGSLLASIDYSNYISTVTAQKTNFDFSRLLSLRAIITENLVERDIATNELISNDQKLIDV